MSSPEPIYRQIAGALENAVLTGALGPGERIMSVRELARACGVNPNTAQRALGELRQTGLLVRGRNGLYAAEDPALILLREMDAIGYKRWEILHLMRDSMRPEEAAPRASSCWRGPL